MSEEKNISLPNYIFYSMSAAWKLARAQPRAMDFFDLSSDGFWKSFFAIVLIVPIFAIKLVSDSNAGLMQPYTSIAIYVVTALPVTAFVMLYFTRFMKIDEHYVSMVIAYNWLNALTVNLVMIISMLLLQLFPEMEMVGIVNLMISFYFKVYVVWFMFKVSLQISGWLAIGVLLFESVFNGVYQIMLMRFIDPEAFAALMQQLNNQPA